MKNLVNCINFYYYDLDSKYLILLFILTNTPHVKFSDPKFCVGYCIKHLAN